MAGGSILALLGKPKDKGAPDDKSPMSSGASDSAEAAALKDMFAAMKAGEWENAAMAFREAYDACSGSESLDDDEPSEGEEDTDFEM
jgi:hypothetical protein